MKAMHEMKKERKYLEEVEAMSWFYKNKIGSSNKFKDAGGESQTGL